MGHQGTLPQDYIMQRLDLGNGITIKSFEPSHAQELLALVDANREFLRLWLPWVDATNTVADSLGFIELARKQQSENIGFHYGVWLKSDLVGGIGINFVDWNTGVAKLGYWLSEHAQGKGIMTTAAKGLIDHMFNVLMMNKVDIRCAVANRKSRAIPERLGFKLEGTLRQVEKLSDGMVDHAVYGMLASEWRQRN